MSQLLNNGRPASDVMALLARQERPQTAAAVGRNDPCPCGSGQKYKRCCGR
jgi:uncharacterized protein YecA (UPF0149 family)